jgi:group I intron endonuclease
MFYVYRIENLVNGMSYVGQRQTKRASLEAWLNDGYMGSGVLIKRAIKKYRKHNFQKHIIDCAETREIANRLEQDLIVFWESKVPNGYNLTDGGDGLTNPLPETRVKISNSLKGNIPWNKGVTGYRQTERARISRRGKTPWNKGRPASAETKAKQSKARMGKVPWNKGVPMQEETKQKLSMRLSGRAGTFTGRRHKLESIIKIKNTKKANPQKGWGKENVHSEESKAKISASKLGKKRVYRKDGTFYMAKPV